jgi:hypothetical protein
MKKKLGFQEIRDELASINEEAALPDGFEEALIGIGHRFGMDPVAVYDRDKCIELLISEGLTREDAEEHFSYNVIGTGIAHAPVFVDIKRAR